MLRPWRVPEKKQKSKTKKELQSTLKLQLNYPFKGDIIVLVD